MSKVILIVCDALRDDVAARQMGYLEHLVEARLASRFTVIGELPTMSRPMYETIHTGVPSSQHGIVNNQTNRLSRMPNLFSLARAAGKTTAASAYHWFSELYIRAPYDIVNDREVDDESQNIQHGRFYLADGTPDIEVFAAGVLLLRRHQPDYLLIHPAGMDFIGEAYGADSPQYRLNATLQDQIMAGFIPEALEAGYHVLVTGDHGMSDDQSHHGGTTPQVRNVPLYLIPPDGNGAGNSERTVSMLQIAPTVCHLLGLEIPTTMTHPPISADASPSVWR